jgi:translation initiation factor IF-2
MKVQDLAKELNMSSNALLGVLKEQRIRVTGVNTKIDPGTADRIKNFIRNKARNEKKEKQSYEAKVLELSKDNIKVSELTQFFGISLADIMRSFLKRGLLVTINSEIDLETAQEVAKEFNIIINKEDTSVQEEIGLKTSMMDIEDRATDAQKASLIKRPPVIAIMGHVDHGKTLLLDKIRLSNVVAKEAGGITQHIGAYQVTYAGNKLTFLDTPGHAAFTSLRARGAQITDVTILVVAADDGVKPQTIEALNHAQAADVPIIVAINKIDKPGANIEQVKQQLSQYNLVAEEWGGSTIFAPISAKTGEGIPELLEMITLVTDMQELRASLSGLSKSVIIESKLSPKRGPLATIIVKMGTLSIGDLVVVDGFSGKIRAIFNDKGESIKSLAPGDPGEILGLSQVPMPGSILEAKASEKDAKDYITQYSDENKSESTGKKMSVSLEALSNQADEGSLRQLNLIIKSDVHGSLEAIKASIDQIDSQDIPIRIIHSSTGAINENDVMLAKASNGVVFGFNTEIPTALKAMSDQEGVIIKSYTIIYEMLDDIEKIIKGLFKTEKVEVEYAELVVRQLFTFSKIGCIAGAFVVKGKIAKHHLIRVIRDKITIYDGKLASLKRFKEDVKEVKEGFECGVVAEKYDDFQEGDKIIAYKIEEKKII